VGRGERRGLKGLRESMAARREKRETKVGQRFGFLRGKVTSPPAKGDLKTSQRVSKSSATARGIKNRNQKRKLGRKGGHTTEKHSKD